MVGDKPTSKEVKRVRQNVLLEFGYFWGRLGRRKKFAILLENDNLEIPSDIANLAWIPITPDLGQTKHELRRELINAGIVR